MEPQRGWEGLKDEEIHGTDKKRRKLLIRLGAESLSTVGRLHELWLVECLETRQSRTVERAGRGGKGGALS